MAKKLLFVMAATVTLSTSARVNPFLTEWNTPYGIPPFNEIRIEDYIPAIKAGIKQQNAEIRAITSSKQVPTFQNTIAPFELSGITLRKVGGVLYNISETDRSPELDKVIENAIHLTTEHENDINFNKLLYRRIAAIYKNGQKNLTREQQMAVKKLYERFIHNGVALPEDKQNELRNINTEIASKTQKFGNNILAENNTFKKRFGISISNYPNAMTTTEDRNLRKEMLEVYTMRGHNGNEYDNRQLALDIAGLRAKKAQLAGYKNAAAYILEDKMACDPVTVDSFLAGIMQTAVKKAKEEVKDMQAVMDKDIAAGKLPYGTKIQPWDWWYYAEKVRKQKYDLDESLTKPYFRLKNVVKGAFLAAKWLYGINMEQLADVPAYNTDRVTTYKATDNCGRFLGIFTTDYLPRSSKRGGAWMNNIREQYVDAKGNNIRPIIVNVANLEDSLTVDEVRTVFHEFGHALHELLTQCHYPSVSGTNVTHDVVEMFSQFNENWAFQPKLLSQYAKDEVTGKVIPQELVDKINNSLKFNQGFMTTELCAASILDMKWHELENIDGVDVDSFEQKVCKEMGLIPEIGPRYRTSYFNHIFSSGYCAGYYGYLWAEVLDKDAFSIFEKSGNVWNKDLARKFKETFLEKGGSEEPMKLYRIFTGRNPDNKAFLKGRGLTE